jgi:hypothetical protein
LIPYVNREGDKEGFKNSHSTLIPEIYLREGRKDEVHHFLSPSGYLYLF